MNPLICESRTAAEAAAIALRDLGLNVAVLPYGNQRWEVSEAAVCSGCSGTGRVYTVHDGEVVREECGQCLPTIEAEE